MEAGRLFRFKGWEVGGAGDVTQPRNLLSGMDLGSLKKNNLTRWWQLKYFFYVHPYLGK